MIDSGNPRTTNTLHVFNDTFDRASFQVAIVAEQDSGNIRKMRLCRYLLWT